MTRPSRLAVAICVATLVGTLPARAFCPPFCHVLAERGPDDAAETLARDLGTPLPSGVTVLRMIDGGFQDRFVQIKLSADAAGAAALLVALRADAKRPLEPEWRQTTIAEAPWWDIDAHTDLALHDARLGRFVYAVVGLAADPSDPARRLIYILAFET